MARQSFVDNAAVFPFLLLVAAVADVHADVDVDVEVRRMKHGVRQNLAQQKRQALMMSL